MGCFASSTARPAQVAPFAGVTPGTDPSKPLAVDFHEKYILGVKLGRGAFAQVRVVTSAHPEPFNPDVPKREMAVKIIDLREKEAPEKRSENLLKNSRKEANIWGTVSKHPNCVRLFEFLCSDHFSFMVMEKCKSSLLAALEGMPELTERGLGNIFAQMLLGISHCHSLRVIHRDVKPDNFLVGGDNGDMIKLCDFGLSATCHSGGKLSGVFGTAPFMPPEMLLSLGYNEKLDVWSFAVVVYALLFGTFPYEPRRHSSKQMKMAIMEGNPPPAFVPVEKICVLPNSRKRSGDALSFVKTLLNRDPDQRPTAEKCLTMPWMVAAIHGAHAPDEELPSLRSALHAARKVGAFEMRDTVTHTANDAILDGAQFKHHGIPLPATPKPEKITRKSGGSMEPKRAVSASGCSSPMSDNKSVCSETPSSLSFSGTFFSGWSKGTEMVRDSSSSIGETPSN